MTSHGRTSPNANTSRPNSDVEDEGCLSDSSLGSLSDHDPIPTAPLEPLNTGLPDAPIEPLGVADNNNNETAPNLNSSFDDVLDRYQVIQSTSGNNANVSFHSQLSQATSGSNLETTSDHDKSDETRGPTRLSHRSFESFRRNSPNMNTRSNSPDSSSRDLTPIPGAITEKVLDELCEKFNIGLKNLTQSRTRRSQRDLNTSRQISPVHSPSRTSPLYTPPVDTTMWPGEIDHILTNADLVDWEIPESNWHIYLRDSPEYTSRTPPPIFDEEDPVGLVGFEFSPTDSSEEEVEYENETGRQLVQVPNLNPRFTATVGLSRSTIRVSEAFGLPPSGRNTTAEFHLCPVEWDELRWRLGNYYQLHLPIFVINNEARIDDASTNHFLEEDHHFLHIALGGFHILSLISDSLHDALTSLESLMDAVARGIFTLTEN